MVHFLTLFLGALIAGPHEVRLDAHRDVAALEIRLDGRSVATLRSPPWKVEVDFGEELAPHRLDAIAYGSGGRELGRVSQWINLSPRDSEISIALDRDPASRQLVARLGWQTLSPEAEPVAARATFDGAALAVRDPRAIVIPEHDPAQIHHLTVELEFAGALRSTAEITFGGPSGDEVDTELTAIPVSVERRRSKLPPPTAMTGWFRAGDRPLAVHAVEEGLAEIVIVRTPQARRMLVPGRKRVSRPVLAKDHRLRFVGARPERIERDHEFFEVFPRTKEIATRVGGLRQTLATVELPNDPSVETRIADAVAVAGLFANRNARRRAVVLITHGDPLDASRFDPRRVRAYLERVGVPLFVWIPRGGTTDAGRWGTARNISTSELLDFAYRELSRELGRQRIVWLDGLHLPQALALGPGIEGLRMVR